MSDATLETPDVEVVLPVHNEAESIEETIREIHDELTRRVSCRFIVCEDGSRDDTKGVLRRLSESVPMKLDLRDGRRGYSRAVVDGLAASEAPYVLCLDSDGQCDPRDFWKLWDLREQYDTVVGDRVDRQDTVPRRAMSGGFKALYRLLVRVRLHDPSCPFVLSNRRVVETLAPELGEMEQGLWWEYNARVRIHGFSQGEVPVNHRLRAAGKTQVYSLSKLPGIGYSHVVALVKIWREGRAGRTAAAAAR